MRIDAFVMFCVGIGPLALLGCPGDPEAVTTFQLTYVLGLQLGTGMNT